MTSWLYDHNDRARTSTSAMSSVDAPRGVETLTHTRQRNLDAQVVIPGLPNDVVVTHVLREKKLPDPIDLATLRVVSRGMREAVDATGLQIKELDEDTATNLGCLTKLRRLQRRGLPKCEFSLCTSPRNSATRRWCGRLSGRVRTSTRLHMTARRRCASPLKMATWKWCGR